MQDIIIKESKIEGKGVFAARDFKKGEIVVKWDVSGTITREEFEKLPEEEKRYISSIDDNLIIMKTPAKYVNHSCNPNTKVVNTSDVAIRDIKKGEEITSDYSQEKVAMKFECKCGSKNCRKIIEIK